jgi:hypothetical protein
MKDAEFALREEWRCLNAYKVIQVSVIQNVEGIQVGSRFRELRSRFAGRGTQEASPKTTSSLRMHYRPFMSTPEPCGPPIWLRLARHPLFACFGLRLFSPSTPARNTKLCGGWLPLVEIGVAEGGSACALGEVMSPSGTLTLIDPFHLSRCKSITATRRVACRAVSRATPGAASFGSSKL